MSARYEVQTWSREAYPHWQTAAKLPTREQARVWLERAVRAYGRDRVRVIEHRSEVIYGG